MLRIWPSLDLLGELVDGLRVLVVAPVAEMSTPCCEHDQAHRVAHLAEHADLALEGRVPQVVDRLQAAGHLLLVPADAGEAALPGQGLLAAGVEVDVLRAPA